MINLNMNINNRIIKLLILLVTLTLVSGCSTYGSSFGCGDGKGASCMPMDKVDKLIASGEIERFTKTDIKCKGGRCKKDKTNNITAAEEFPEIQREGAAPNLIEINLNGLD